MQREGIMFREVLLESTPGMRKRSHWAMATAFAVELAVGAVLVLLPLVSTGIIPLKATMIVPTPPQYTPLQNREPVPRSGGQGGVSVPVAHIVPVSTIGQIHYGKTTSDWIIGDPPPLNPCGDETCGDKKGGVDLGLKGTTILVQPPVKVLRVSHTIDAMLVKKVDPEYPVIAKISGIQGDVRLHAFVAKDGTIQSLTVLGNPPPVLSQAALSAVQQWKYRPYILNGEPVEIETFITVTFRKTN